ncbi:DUF4232 domain-containing protein [Streptomyces rapamycinicus]|uniref:DUF4232 domain-containing protein n=2 Tax=Streptomyces rapamycinicus TaxID=1226757 RepID=A0A0A0NJE0_STRRN|nr:DUF4232 domain-containing protein [Streptomyces rapamycinicus]AGP56223.1 hypothetical protein M271_23590 [Streptomyces rapamycinicus NRRL 5491]MBB4783818.1 hypothetical protein [Streptomyces rapamycinicus]RLV80693.1 hypothetical protein D3C57_119950 [Streptomyces rapamycinicus NRRL 5491]UTO64190.1 DUF4232 domain-containing protein [Streptomyces rapamycinicus]UTP32145.1 DUF4232 domain-containing protein [Streptomyces rapamycinicus NRRL 5491]
MSRTTVLRRTRTVAVASLIAAAAFSLTACGGGESDSDAKGGSASATANGTSGGSGGGSGSTGGSGEDIDAKAGNASGGSSSASRCTSDHLEAAWSNFEGGPDMEYDGQQTARVVLKNTGSTDCTMVGFPGVQLQTEHGETWDLRRTDDKPKPVRVDAGGRVTFDITFLASTRDDDKKFAPDQVVITPPNEEANLSLDWPYGGALLDQSGATRPGTFVGPVSTPE